MKIPLCKKEMFDPYAMHGNSFDDLNSEVGHSTDITTVPCLHPDKGYKEWALIKTILCCHSIASSLIYYQTSKDAIVMAAVCLALNQYGGHIKVDNFQSTCHWKHLGFLDYYRKCFDSCVSFWISDNLIGPPSKNGLFIDRNERYDTET